MSIIKPHCVVGTHNILESNNRRLCSFSDCIFLPLPTYIHRYVMYAYVHMVVSIRLCLVMTLDELLSTGGYSLGGLWLKGMALI